MQFVAANDIREGMVVAQDVADPTGRTLIARGQTIGMHHIVRLRKFKIANIFIDPTHGEQLVKPTQSELRDQCQKVLQSACGKLTQEMANKRLNLDAKAIQEALASLVDALMKSKNPLVTLLDVSTSGDRMFQHSVNTAVLSTVLGMDLHMTEGMLKDLAAGMLFHDMGMIFLPDDLSSMSRPINAEEAKLIKKHAEMGFEHLLRSNAISTVAGNIVFRHHEMLDGSGYPAGIGGDKLSPLIRIASVVEAYDSLTTARFGFPAVMPDQAISFLISNAGKLYSKEVVAALCKHVALYPVGCAVQLNTGERGLVAGLLPTAPTRPVILIHIDNKGRKLSSPLVVDLTCDAGHSVVKSAHNLEALMADKTQPQPPRPVDVGLAMLG